MRLHSNTFDSLDLVSLVSKVLNAVEQPFSVAFAQAHVRTLDCVAIDLVLVESGIHVVFCLEESPSQVFVFLLMGRQLAAVVCLVCIVQHPVRAVKLLDLFAIQSKRV